MQPPGMGLLRTADMTRSTVSVDSLAASSKSLQGALISHVEKLYNIYFVKLNTADSLPQTSSTNGKVT